MRGQIDGAELLFVAAGNTIFRGPVGDGGKRLDSLTVDGGGKTILNGASVETAGDQSYRAAIELGASATLGGRNVTFSSTVDSEPEEAWSLFVNTHGAGVTHFEGAIGGSERLASISTNADGKTQFGGGSINLDGAGLTRFGDTVLLLTDVAINQIGGGDVAVGGGG